MRVWSVFVVWCVLSVSAQAQTPALPNRVEVLVLPATGDPLTVAPIASIVTDLVAAVCNLAPTPAPPAPVVNPTSAEFDDPVTAGRVCHVPLPPLTAIPNGVDYRGVAVFVADTCEINGKPATNCRSPRSALAVPPFTVNRVGPPAAPTRLVIRP